VSSSAASQWSRSPWEDAAHGPTFNQRQLLDDIELLTQPTRGGGGMDALGTFEVAFDANLNCVYFPGDGDVAPDEGRTAPIWPFGYPPIRIRCEYSTRTEDLSPGKAT